MAAKGKRGVKGQPHWKVEAEVRSRTSLTRAGADPVLGAAEVRLMVGFAEAAKKGSPYMEIPMDGRYVTRGTRRFAHVSRMVHDVSRDSRRALRMFRACFTHVSQCFAAVFREIR